jgi:hypothetical protein
MAAELRQVDAALGGAMDFNPVVQPQPPSGLLPVH